MAKRGRKPMKKEVSKEEEEMFFSKDKLLEGLVEETNEETEEIEEENTSEEVEVKTKETKKSLPIIEIFKSYMNPIPEWQKFLTRTCSICGRKDYPAYELLQLKNSDKKMQMVCYDCIIRSGYERVYGHRNWDWRKIVNVFKKEEEE